MLARYMEKKRESIHFRSSIGLLLTSVHAVLFLSSYNTPELIRGIDGKM